MTAAWSKRTDQLVRAVAGRVRPRLQLELGHWIEDNARFRTFVEQHQDKIRKKLSSDDEEARLDVRAELLVAQRLLADRRFEVAFETYGAQRLGPDLSVTFRVNQRIDVEVTRVRGPGAVEASKLAKVVAGKLRQLQSGLPNLVVVIAEGVSDEALREAMRLVKARADPHYVRLSGVLVLDEGHLSFAANPEARHEVPKALIDSISLRSRTGPR